MPFLTSSTNLRALPKPCAIPIFIGGGGQPFHRGRMEVLRKRAAALYQEDRSKTLRKSHENPYIQALYADYLGEPCGPRAHKLLHTHYFDRKEAINMFTQENQEG